MLRLILLALSVAAIAQIPAPNIVGGDVPSGASNLTTVGAIPYVSASGVLNQDPNFRWISSTKTLSITNASGTEIMFSGSSNGTNISTDSNFLLNIDTGDSIPGSATFEISKGSSYYRLFTVHDFGVVQLGQDSDTPITQEIKSHDALSTGAGSDFLLKSGQSSGLNQAGGKLILRGGQPTGNSGSGGSIVFQGFTIGSSGNALQTVVDRMKMFPNGNLMIGYSNDNGNKLAVDGVALAVSFVNADGDMRIKSGSIDFGNAAIAAWSSTGAYNGTKDLSLSRASAGVLQVGDGGSNANGVVSLTRSQHAGVLVANLPAAAAGNAGSIQYVTDANATTIGSTVAGGGANKVMVWSDGAAWKIFAN